LFGHAVLPQKRKVGEEKEAMDKKFSPPTG